MTVVFMFPSQSSRYAGMIAKIVRLRPALSPLLDEASEAVGFDCRERYLSGDPDVFRRKSDQRIGIFLMNYLMQRALQDEGVEGDLSLGFSLGEYNHLVHAGALSFAEALKLLMRPAPPEHPDPVGERAVVYRIGIRPLRGIVERGREHGLVEVGGEMTPHIHHIVGEEAAVRWVCERIKEEKPRARSMFLPTKLPLHCELMRPVADRLAAHLQTIEISVPDKPYLPNVLGKLVHRPDRAAIIDLMARHLCEPVRWRQSIDHVVRRHPGAVFVEVGPRRALAAFFYLEKTWHPKTRYYITDELERDDDHWLRKVVEEVRPKPSRRFASEALAGRFGFGR
ncbi:MAG TPA: ACP S-malonyltransferase [Thermoanaerobaculia bacterium]|nr:ACP S-malonyltransferase [Thermoanaerobaculia bacterium]